MQDLCQPRPRILPPKEPAWQDSSLSGMPPQEGRNPPPREKARLDPFGARVDEAYAARTPTNEQTQSKVGKAAPFVPASRPRFMQTTVSATRARPTAHLFERL